MRHTLFFIFGIVITTFCFYWLQTQPQFFDPDSFYHLFILKEMQDQNVWFLRTLPQLPELGWASYFSDKEFLFHVILQVPYRILGANAVAVTAALFGAMIVWLPFMYVRQRRWTAVGISFALIVLQPHLLIRFAMLRPHVLAILLFSALLWSIWRQQLKIIFALTCILALSYHAFYVPLLTAILLFTFSLFPDHIIAPLARRQSLYILAGLACGILINPYFPSNLLRMWQHLVLALQGPALSQRLNVSLGMELQPLGAADYLINFGLLSVILFFTVFKAWADLIKKQSINISVLLPGSLSALFFLASFFSPRAIEFMAPCLVLFVFANVNDSSPKLLLKLLVGILLLQLYPIYELIKVAPMQGIAPKPMRIAALLQKLPVETQDIVFNCNWGLAPYILHERHQAKVIDILDPSFLYMANPQKFAARLDLNYGRLSNPLLALKNIFKANYVLCDNFPLTKQLLNLPGATMLDHDEGLAFFRLD